MLIKPALKQHYLTAMGIQVWQERVMQKNNSTESVRAFVDQEKPCYSGAEETVCSFCESRHQGVQQVMASRNTPVEWLVIVKEIVDNESAMKLKLNEQSNQLIRGILQAASVGKAAMVLPVDASRLETGDNELSETAQDCCRQSLLDDISTIQPALVLMFGEDISTGLLVKRKPSEQGKALVQSIGGLTCPVIVTYGLTELLQNPLLKKKVWADIQLALSLKN